MKLTRQHLLLGVLIAIGAVSAGDWLLKSMIQGPLDERRARTEKLEEEVEKLEKVLAEGRRAGKKIDAWQQRSLPPDTENTACEGPGGVGEFTDELA